MGEYDFLICSIQEICVVVSFVMDDVIEGCVAGLVALRTLYDVILHCVPIRKDIDIDIIIISISFLLFHAV